MSLGASPFPLHSVGNSELGSAYLKDMRQVRPHQHAEDGRCSSLLRFFSRCWEVSLFSWFGGVEMSRYQEDVK